MQDIRHEYPIYPCLKGKRVLITGANKGIGKELAIAFASQNSKLTLTYAHDREGAEIIENECKNYGAEVLVTKLLYQSSTTISETIQKKFNKYNGIDILINNGAIAQEKPFLELTEHDWDNMMAVNLRGAFLAIQKCIPHMINNKWGRIINLTSIGGQWGGINQIHYATAKSGLVGLTKSIAKTFSKYNITCNAISPGLIKTDMIKDELNTIQGQEKLKLIPRGCLGSTSDVSSAALYLCSEQAHYITGQTININGGMYFG